MTAGNLTDVLLGPPGVWRIIRVIVVAFAIAALIRLLPYRPPDPARPSRRRRRILIPVTVAAAVFLAGGCAVRMTYDHDEMARARATMGHAGTAAVASPSLAAQPEIGVFEPGATASYRLVDEFTRESGIHPGIVLYYSGWNDPFQIRFAGWAHHDGAEPFAQMLPNGITMASVVAGDYDGYLRSFASAVRSYGHPVILGFAPEMNGNWYAWGVGRTPPAQWIAAWRHVVTTFRRAGASNVTWLWTVSDISAVKAPVSQWWPGPAYVDEIGIDGYYYKASDTFSAVFGNMIDQVHRFTADPVLVSETAVGPAAGPAKIADLFSGARRAGVTGLVWFDQAQDEGVYHQDWRLEDSPAALAAFRKAAS